MTSLTVTHELETLRARVAELEFEIERRDECMMPQVVAIMRCYNVSKTHALMIRLLSSGGCISRERMLEEYRGEDLDIRNVDSQIKRIRQRIGSLTIRNVYGLGYDMDHASCAQVRAVMSGSRKHIVFPYMIEAHP